MLATLWKSDERIHAADVRAEVGDFDWPTPVETQACASEHQISLSISRRPAHSQVRYDLATTGGRFVDVGDVVFFPAAVPFSGRSDGGRQRLLVCSFAGERWSQFDRPESWTDTELVAALDVKDSSLRRTLNRMVQEVANPGFVSGVLIEALLTTALVDLTRYLNRRSGSEKPRTGGLAPWQMRRLKERVAAVSLDTPTTGELARLCAMSSRHLTRSFKNASGTTLHRYIEEVRLSRAKSLLTDTDLPLKIISWQLGFAHPSSFSSAFQRALGQTPSAFRARCGRNSAA